MKKTILHLIYSLGRGGAETMLVRVLKELPEYKNILVTLKEDNHFTMELQCDEYLCLHKPSLPSITTAAIQLRKIIKKYKVDIVHSHLPQSNFVARLATPQPIPLITTIHTSIATAVDYKKWYIRLLDKFTYHYRSSIIIAVSQGALNDYFSVLKLKPQITYLLYTFVDTNQYSDLHFNFDKNKIRIISIGALRKGKNYTYLVEAFQKLKNQPVELHIYGDGPEKENLQKLIENEKLPILLKGQVDNIHEVLPQYNLFVMSSRFEGFSLSVLEAMAAKLPLLLSDIVSFNEQCGDCAIYFDLDDSDDFVKKLQSLIADEELLHMMSAKANKRVHDNFTLQHHVTKLKDIYKAAIKGA